MKRFQGLGMGCYMVTKKGDKVLYAWPIPVVTLIARGKGITLGVSPSCLKVMEVVRL